MEKYDEIYLIMVRAVEKAVRILIEAQQECEELYINTENEKSPVSSPAGEAGGSKGASRNAPLSFFLSGVTRFLFGEIKKKWGNTGMQGSFAPRASPVAEAAESLVLPAQGTHVKAWITANRGKTLS